MVCFMECMLAVKRDMEAVFTSWSTGPGTTEEKMCENAVTAIKKAIAKSPKLSKRDIKVFAQGSYPNRTNISKDSDVDVCVLCQETTFFETDGKVQSYEWGSLPAVYNYGDFKKEVGEALVAYFGQSAVSPGNKAFDIHQNTYRIDADVAPCFVYRYYNRVSSGGYANHTGTALQAVDWELHSNFPDQHLKNGKDKNALTRRRFKKLVRILKSLRNEMLESGINEADKIPSFLIESLVWNVPTAGFINGSFMADVRWVLAHIHNETMKDATCNQWTEINGIKLLFYTGRPWPRAQVNTFCNLAWHYLGFK